MVIKDTQDTKVCLSPEYNFVYNKKSGFFARWGKTLEDDPQTAPSPEILDIEVTEICAGVPDLQGVRKPCKFCYKANGNVGRVMTMDTFKTVLSKFPKTLTQVAFGADSQALSCPDLFDMMRHCRALGIVPNITVADIDDRVADQLAELCGAVAVSRYENPTPCFDSVKKLTDRGMSQVNIHQMVSQETKFQCLQTISSVHEDPRLARLNALVFLSLKPKGRGLGYHALSQESYKTMVDFAMSCGISFGMDSCSAHKFLAAIKDHPDYERMAQLVEPCEATCFSSYVNARGHFYPCSFAESGDGIDVTAVKDFDEIWNHPKTQAFRESLLSGDRHCPLYSI
jgi:hypothetical protein